MKKIIKGILPGLLLVTLATPGFAENRQGAVTVSPFVGGYVLDHDQSEENRPMFGLRAGYNFTKNWGAEGMFGYSLTETKSDFGSREVDNYRYGLDFLYHFMPDSNLVPFLAVGGGMTHFQIPTTPSADNHYAGLVNYGAGVKYFVADNVALRGDVRHVLLVHDTGHNNLEYSVGLTFQFGGVKKAVAAKAAAAVVPAAAEVTDNTPPTVVFTAPVNGATTVYANQKASVAFSEEMDPASITGETFTLKQGDTPLSGRVSTTDSTATFAPANNFEKGKSYTATVKSGVKDLAGNAMAADYVWGFTAGQDADTTPPTVTFTSPVEGATAAPIRQNINVAFSENMDPATINTATYTLMQGATPVDGKVKSSAATAAFVPAKKLEKGKEYNARVTTGAKDLAGNPMAKDYNWKFTAYSEPKVIGVLVTMENSHFEFDKSDISENGKTILDLNIATLKANPTMQIRVAGYTSAAGSEEYNQALSERRADAVKAYLVQGGIDADRVATIGYGKKSPAKFEANPADKRSPEALANMRVVVEIIED